MSRRALVIALAVAAGCADGKSALTVHVTSDGTIAGIDHFAVTVTEAVTPSRSVGPISVKPSSDTIPPEQQFSLTFDKDVRATVDIAVDAVDGSGATLSSGTGSIAVVPSERQDLTVTLPGSGGGDMSANGGSGGDLGGVPDLAPPPGCPVDTDGGVVAVGDPCTGSASHACYGGPNGTCGVGACRPGVQYCLDGAWGPCLGEVGPQPEVCDGRDQDCNGTADDGLGTFTCGLGATQNTVPACTGGKPTVCVAKNGVAESCDGIDNDGNGAIDELGCPAIHVAPSGSDSTGDGSAAMPYRTIAKGIAAAQASSLAPKLVYAASGTSCPTTFNYNEQVVMVDGVHVYGGYESTNWTRNVGSCITQLSKVDGNPTVSFSVNVVHPTILDGVDVGGRPSIGISGSTGAVVSNSLIETSCGFGDSNCSGIVINDYFGAPAKPLITRNRFNQYYWGIHSTKSAPIIVGNCETRDATGHCVTNCSGTGWAKGFYGAGFVSIELDYSPGAVVAENQICAGPTSIALIGDAQGTIIRANSITPTNQGASAIGSTTCNGAPWIVDNTQLSGGSAGNGNTAIGIQAKDGCQLRIDHNVLITGATTGGNGDSYGIWCQRDTGTLRESRCQIVGNAITVNKATTTGQSYGVRCEDLCCARIEGNHVTGGAGANSYGLVLGRTGTLVARNIIDSGCMGGTTGVSSAVEATDSFARFENNLIRGGACGGNVYGMRVHLVSSGDEVDLDSNNIFGGGVAAGCSGHALSFDVGATSPASGRGLVRNNILSPGPCSATAWDIYEGAAMASPRVLANNDLAPVPTLYHSNASGDLTTIAAVNLLPGAAANFSADPMLQNDQIHLNAGSMCIDSGAAGGAPAEDYDAMTRPMGGGFDVGMDEK